MVASWAPAQVDVSTVMQRSVEATRADWMAAPQYSYKETDRGHGGSKTYEVRMIEGSPYNRLIAINGSPLPAEREKEEQEKFN
jgi:hypothetical protein